jgi:energy-coupling factor transport system ATP-binding protein
VSEEVAFGPRQQKLPSEELAQRVAEALDQVGLDESYAVRNPFLLSQGEKRRVALAGVLAMRPEMLILDEPTASLDANGTEEVYALLQRWQTAGKTLVTISHDFELIARFCPRLLSLEKGRLVYDGMAASLWQEKPRNPNQNILEKAGLPLPRSERLRRHLTERGFQWQTISILQENSK